jgi:hypothetical protein
MRLRRSACVLALLALMVFEVADGKRRKRKASAPPAEDHAHAAAMQHHHEGVMAHVQGNLAAATAAFRKAVAAKPDFAYGYYRLGFVLHEEEVRRGKWKPPDDAEPMFRYAAARHGSHTAELGARAAHRLLTWRIALCRAGAHSP